MLETLNHHVFIEELVEDAQRMRYRIRNSDSETNPFNTVESNRLIRHLDAFIDEIIRPLLEINKEGEK